MSYHKDNGIIFGLGAAAIVAVAGAVKQRGSSARGHQWVPSGGGLGKRWSWTGVVDGDTVDVTVMPGSSAYVPYVVVREHELSLPHTSGPQSAQRIARDAYLNQLAMLNKLARQGSRAMDAKGFKACGGRSRVKTRGSRGHRHEASEWVDFFAGGNASRQTKALGKRFDEAVWPVFERWFETPMGRKSGLDADDFDHHDVAYRTFSTFAGHGISLDDGELFYEQGVSRDKSYKLGKDLRQWMEHEFNTSSLLYDAHGNPELYEDLNMAIHDDDFEMHDED